MTTAYATYTYYTGTFLGTAIASANFNRLALLASALIDQVTFNRAAAIVTANTETATIDAIKMATCAVAEEIQKDEADGSGGGIQSETVGRHSVTYVNGAPNTRTDLQKQSDAAKLYLASTGLMFRGFNADER